MQQSCKSFNAMGDSIVEKGHQAFRDGLAFDANPYLPSSSFHAYWGMGWMQEQENKIYGRG